jgi:hypothetical protein
MRHFANGIVPPGIEVGGPQQKARGDGIGARDELAVLPDPRVPSLPKAPTVDYAGGASVYSGIPEDHCDALMAWVKGQREENARFLANQLNITLT